MSHVSTSTASLATSPSLVYREIAGYFTEAIAIRCDMTLQRCCNPAFAREVRRVIKDRLQYVEAGVALNSEWYFAKHPTVFRNLLSITALTFEDLCPKLNDVQRKISNRRDFGPATFNDDKRHFKLLPAYIEAHRSELKRISHADTIFRRDGDLDVTIIAEDTSAEHPAGPAEYHKSTKLYEGVSLVVDGISEKFDWAISRTWTLDGYGDDVPLSTTLVKSSGECCFVEARMTDGWDMVDTSVIRL